MWQRLGQWILKWRLFLLISLLAATLGMGFIASKVQLSYDFTRAIPTDNEKYVQYESFKQKFGENGGLLVIGIQSDKFYTTNIFNAVSKLDVRLKAIKGVDNVLSVPEAVMLVKDSSEKLVPQKIFSSDISQQQLDSAKGTFENLPFYKGLLYNPQTRSYLIGINVNKDVINTKYRSTLVAAIVKEVKGFEKETGLVVHTSGLPFIRTTVGDLIKTEMKWFLIGSLILSAVTLLLFFRSLSAVVMSLLVVIFGVIWSLATIVLLGYKITLLTALIPPLLVVIGIPNCIYFLNKYHSAYLETKDKKLALVSMVDKMGIVTLFCNIAAAIGFAVFALTRSALLKEFGVVAGINIMLLFIISLIFIPSVLSYLEAPRPQQLKYLDNRLLIKTLQRLEKWSLYHQRSVYVITAGITIIALVGIFRLKSEAFIVDDLPKTDKIYTDLKWFENNFKGVMPLEIVVDTKKKKGVTSSLKTIERIDEFSSAIAHDSNMSRPLSVVEGLKFAKQAFYDNDSASYAAPSEFDMAFLAPILKGKEEAKPNTGPSKLLNGFIDSTKQFARISVNMKDVGSVRLPVILDTLEKQASRIFDTLAYNIQFTGASVTFLEGSSFIIKGLKDSIIYAFLLIALCMLYLFRSFKILLCSLIPNVVPLVITAGVMGWFGIALRPSTVLVFSVALGIAIDVTIRFLINYKQELPSQNNAVEPTIVETIRHTGISIIYTSLVLIAGFIIFCFSGFGGTQALGWLTSLTLITGTITNLTLLPVLLLAFRRKH
ncbi:MAG: integral rane protein [Segetibacter sp.]|nr:integral rane protein [Segetibacter sp.]